MHKDWKKAKHSRETNISQWMMKKRHIGYVDMQTVLSLI